ncbi:hypothetical protein TRICI_004162 [Trichomonascus ciferrii]|uniref:Nop domain-containing protein n=1 Tax=Trichomonascus ciferrii TaxID=44093 RepID=A0A642V6S5_9ASCO|nr:hypothetical protein TRICI_004162 [Trichomonascus ciferrii]
MSLADELLADLDSGDEGMEMNGEDVKLEDEENDRMDESHDTQQPRSSEIASLSTLMDKLEPLLRRIEEDLQQGDLKKGDLQGNIMHHPTYKLLVEANDYSVDIDNEIIAIRDYIKNLYKKRFAELDQLVPGAVDYARAVKIIGNNLQSISEELKTFLPGATFMIITMSAYENKGKELSPHELEQVLQACDLLLRFDDAKHRITSFVSHRLSVFAPNVTQIVSSHTAAQLMGFAGGLSGLSKMPNSNVPALGAKRQVSAGFGQTTTRQQGFLYHSELIQSVPPDLRKKAMKMVSGKLVLAARVDLSHSMMDGSRGLEWRKEINEKLEKMVEPPENKPSKALPVPEDKKSKKRGGKRIRKFKEQFQMTELQKAQNRMAFGKEEEEAVGYGEESIGLGMAGIKASTGNVRNVQLDNKTKAKMSKGMQARVQSLKSLGDETSGTQSSLAFTPVQGIELVAPTQPKQSSTENKWFNNGTFTNVTSSKKSDGEFTLPNKRKLDLPGPDPKKPKDK